MSLVLSGYDWSKLCNSGYVSNSISVFYCIAYDVIQQFVPTNTVNEYKFSTWFSPELWNFLKKKTSCPLIIKIYKKLFRLFGVLDLQKFCKRLIHKCYSDSLTRIQYL